MQTWDPPGVLGWSAYVLGWLFLVYGFLGMIIETVYCLLREKALECRFGLLYLPLRPMYGVGGVACTVLLDRFQAQPVVVLCGGLVICTAIEYVGGSLCDRLFGTLSWDYRGKALHLNGKICLQYSCCWALLAGLVVYVLSPLVTDLARQVESTVGVPMLTTLLGLFVASLILTVAAWIRVRRRLDALSTDAGPRPEKPSESMAGRLVDRLVPDRLLITTFPRTRLTQELAAVTGHQPLLISGVRAALAPTASRL